jgi:hypothetical protein
MAEFLQKISSTTLRYANQLFSGRPSTMRQSAESRLCTMQHSTELRLNAMLHGGDSTHIREYLGKIETKFENILG